MGPLRFLPFLAVLLPVASARYEPILGFGDDSARVEVALEAKLDSAIKPDDQREWLHKLSLKPHHLGSPYGLENAHTILALYKSFGFDAHIETFQVMFPTPKARILELLGPGGYRAGLSEPVIPGDPSSQYAKDALPPYNAYSRDGDVTAELVYVNYGLPKDYEELEKRGIDVKGKIVLARYGASWRGVKPKVAAEHGAVGCILFSDPHDDGYGQGDMYPVGPWRNGYGVQRGSVSEMTLYPGDPLTPGVGATADAKRIKLEDAPTITKIPTLPIGAKDALPLVASLTGEVAPPDWRGDFPVTYHIGPSRAKVHLKVAFNWNMVEARDIVAKLQGSEFPDEWVIRGNHHDGWVCGAEDPLSGQVALLSEAKALGTLAKEGWRPKRTIVYCSWDGEEPGLIGSTEWAEEHADELSEKAVAYINSDSNGRGFFGAEGSPVLRKFITQVASDVADPETSLSVLTRLRDRDMAAGTPEAKKLAEDKQDIELGPLGSGSDYSTFIQHLGIPCLDIGYGGESSGTQYHSTYDSFTWFTRFVDPTFAYGATLSKTGGRAVLRLADADKLPFDHHHFVTTVAAYAKEVAELLDKERKETAETNKMLDDGTLQAAADPTKHYVLPARKPDVPKLDFTALNAAVARLRKVVDSVESSDSNSPAWNQTMRLAERQLLGPGLPGRPWYRHVITAPGEYTGYGAKTLPGIREAIEARKWPLAQDQIKVAAETLDHFTDFVEKGLQS
jgi:N-acetylated-alpha-linked acidic dipeptidase